jgi:hypothetical protein
MLEILFSPMGLILGGLVIYLARRGGELKFRTPRHNHFADELNDYVLRNYHLVSQNNEFTYDLRTGVQDKIRMYMDAHSITRMQVHDLKHTVVKTIEEMGRGHGHDVEFRVSRSTIAYEIGKIFDNMIEQYDRSPRRWSSVQS